MPLPKEVVAAKERMDRADAEMRAYVDRGEHDRDKHHALAETLRRAVHDYLDKITSLCKDLSH
jgi:hypothetical protein